MFGRSKFVNGATLFDEMVDSIDVVSLVIDKLDLACNDHDYERMTVWNASSVVYCVKMWGKTDDSSLKEAFTRYGIHLRENDADSSALMSQFTASLYSLGRNLTTLNIAEVERAARDFRINFESLRQGYEMPAEEFDSWAVSSFTAILKRLADKKLIRAT